MNKEFPTLYKLSSTGKAQFWRISVYGNVINTTWGQLDGKHQGTDETIGHGKNKGRSNETTPEEQALAEATSRWEGKLKRGYVQKLKDAEAGKVDKLIKGGVAPMLAKVYEDQADKLTFPCFMQPKLDGHRIIAVIDDIGDVTLWSRTRKPIYSVPHIVKALKALDLRNVTFDGEGYNHDLRDDFDQLSSLLRKNKPAKGCEKIEYHIYDLIDFTRSQRERVSLLGQIAKRYEFQKPLVRVDTISIADAHDLKIQLKRYRKAGYEGGMARNRDAMYVSKRTHDLLKLKVRLDDEFEIIGVNEGRGKLAGHAATFTCVTNKKHPKPGVTFKAKLKGETAALKKYLAKPSLAIGKMLTVEFHKFNPKSGVPIQPVALRMREDI